MVHALCRRQQLAREAVMDVKGDLDYRLKLTSLEIQVLKGKVIEILY